MRGRRGSSPFLSIPAMIVILLFCIPLVISGSDWALELPPEHIPFQLNSDVLLSAKCKRDPSCPFKEDLDSSKCWGYEVGCRFEDSYAADKIKCKGKSKWPSAQAHSDQIRTMWSQGDFGYIQDRKKDMAVICDSDTQDGSQLVCSDHMRHCYGNNMFFDFKSLRAKEHSNKYREDVIHEGEVGGKCTKKLHKERILKRSDHKSPLQSWAAELLPFESYDDFQMDAEHCDIIYDKPTVVFKLDAAVSMFHHFCDFVNLYASQHINGSFDRDINIVLWDTSAYGFWDNMFGITWDVFTSNPLIQLKDLDGKKVCFRSVMMPLLARQRFGFYYNMPVIDVCSGTGFFQAFSQHVTHRLGITQQGPKEHKVRVTILSRSTKYRRMLNEETLVNAVKTLRNVEVTRIDYNSRMPFRDQLVQTKNSDVLVGMHGSGLTHLLFLPDWAGVFEVYNCGDPACYWDLSRLRGVRYRTWEKAAKIQAEDEGHHPTTGGPHEKFTNYEFDVAEFVRIVEELVDGVEADPGFRAARDARFPSKEEL